MSKDNTYLKDILNAAQADLPQLITQIEAYLATQPLPGSDSPGNNV
jgi:hypothetical protein